MILKRPVNKGVHSEIYDIVRQFFNPVSHRAIEHASPRPGRNSAHNVIGSANIFRLASCGYSSRTNEPLHLWQARRWSIAATGNPPISQSSSQLQHAGPISSKPDLYFMHRLRPWTRARNGIILPGKTQRAVTVTEAM